MLVTKRNLSSVLESLRSESFYGLDTETNGLRIHQGDSLFSLIISTEREDFYFNFKEYDKLDRQWVLPRAETFQSLKPIFEDPEKTWAIHNAKFDLAALSQEGIEVAGTIWDTEVNGRLLYNRHLVYNLGALLKEVGREKDDTVETYVKDHKLYTWLKSPGKAKKAKKPHYDQVPFAIISKYGESDGANVRALAVHQEKALAEKAATIPKDLPGLIENEKKIVKACFRMEKIGIKIDESFCQVGYEREKALADEAAQEFEAVSGCPLVDSGKALSRAFDAVGEKYPRTAKGNPSFKQDVLEGFTTPLAKLVLRYREASKRAGTYYANFLYFADEYSRVHPNMRQAGTDTGRFSYSDPNLQNCPKDEPGDFKVRSSFIPTSADWCFVMIDYDQMEYRLMLDYAAETGVIRQVLGGMDVHEATAKLMGVSRQEAKTLNFMLLYGGGVAKLAAALGISIERANQLKRRYFKALEKVQRFTRRVIDTAERRGYVYNWAGRICHFPYLMNPRTGRKDRFAYKAPNHLIQGGCADVVRFAMTDIDQFLQGYRSRMLLQVHDELLFEVHKSELDIVPELKRIMEGAYPHKHLPLTCGVDHSWQNWGAKVAGFPKIT